MACTSLEDALVIKWKCCDFCIFYKTFFFNFNFYSTKKLAYSLPIFEKVQHFQILLRC